MEKKDVISAEMQHMRQEQEAKVKSFRVLNAMAKKGAILFTGSSLMEQFPVCEIAQSRGFGKVIYNRGIGGTTTDDFLREIDTVLLDLEPAKVFLNIGTNDMTDRIYGEKWMDHLEENYGKILQIARERLPQTEIFCMAYYPTNRHLPDQNEWVRNMLKERTAENIAECNRRVAALAEKYGCRYIDVNEGLADENGEQKREFAIDGVHMLAGAYAIVFENLRPYL
jgi:lysophospholipase L1-like esterase